jgi:cytochrome c-type biogenesis protein CcmH
VRRYAAIGGGLVIVAALVIAFFRPQHQTPEQRAHNLEEHIACPVCTGESVADSNSEASAVIRQGIQTRIKEGQSDQTILQYYESRYPKQQLDPSSGGIGLVAWGLPVVAVILAITGLGFAVVRWKREPRLVATEDDEALVRRARSQA